MDIIIDLQQVKKTYHCIWNEEVNWDGTNTNSQYTVLPTKLYSHLGVKKKKKKKLQGTTLSDTCFQSWEHNKIINSSITSNLTSKPGVNFPWNG